MPLGKQIRRYRTARGLTLDALAEAAGVEVGTISALENRDSRRSMYAAPIAKVLGLTVEQLLDDTRDWVKEPLGYTPTLPPPQPSARDCAHPSPPPPAPPAGFRDRRIVNESDWALLQDVKDGATPEELERIRERATLLRHRVDELMAERIAAASSGNPPARKR